MMWFATTWSSVAASVTPVACLAPASVFADRWEVWREARREIRLVLREDYCRDQYYRGSGRWYRDDRY
jgi:hypothetical protein